MKQFLTLITLSFLWSPVFSQDTIRISNPSLEDEPRMGIIDQYGRMSSVPRNWTDCGPLRFPGQTPPDIHPNNYFNVKTQPSEGISYLGMVVRDDDSQESISQRLTSPLEKGKCYIFSVDLCKSNDYVKGTNTNELITTPIVLRIYGGSGLCHQGLILDESVAVKNTTWQSYNFEFRPNRNLRYITFEAYYKTPVLIPYNGNLLIDNMSDIIQIACPGEELIAAVEEKPKVKKKPPHKRKPKKEPKKEIVVDAPAKVATEEPKKKKKILAELDRKKLTKGQTIRIDKLFFAADTTNVQPESYPVLNEVYEFMKDNGDIVIEIGGHTNGLPKHSYCDRLSEARAKEVASYLIRKGLSSNRVQYKGYGKRKPIASNQTKNGRKKNQRVEIKILSFES